MKVFEPQSFFFFFSRISIEGTDPNWEKNCLNTLNYFNGHVPKLVDRSVELIASVFSLDHSCFFIMLNKQEICPKDQMNLAL